MGNITDFGHTYGPVWRDLISSQVSGPNLLLYLLFTSRVDSKSAINRQKSPSGRTDFLQKPKGRSFSFFDKKKLLFAGWFMGPSSKLSLPSREWRREFLKKDTFPASSKLSFQSLTSLKLPKVSRKANRRAHRVANRAAAASQKF